VAVWISLGFVTFAGYASCTILYQFVRMQHSKNVFYHTDVDSLQVQC